MPKLTIYGARGSEPVCGEDFCKYGGRTSCYSVETDEGLIILDAGTGIATLGRLLDERETLPPVDLFFTHFHLDHALGLALFKPMYRKDLKLTIWADGQGKASWQKSLKTLFGKPFWPIALAKAGAEVTFKDLPKASGTTLERHGIRLSWCPVRHPELCTSYRLELGDQVVVLATDREYGETELDEQFVSFAKGADVLIHDAHYETEQYPRHIGWGHSTWEGAAASAKKANVGELILTHHHPLRTDQQIDDIVARAQQVFPNTSAAREGMVVGESVKKG